MSSPNQLTVLVVSSERPLLRRLHDLLSSFGYEPVVCANVDSAAAHVRLVEPAIVILDHCDWDETRVAVRKVREATDAALVLYLLHDGQAAIDSLEAVELGIDDILQRTINNAEILTRLRTGSRVLEFEHRVKAILTIDKATQLLSRRGLVDRLTCLRKSDSRFQQCTCTLLQIDLWERFAAGVGKQAAQGVENQVAQRLRESCAENVLLASLGGGRFGVVLPETTTAAARDKVEQLRKVLADAVRGSGGADHAAATISAGLAELSPGDDDVHGLLNRAREALRLAGRNGRDCVVAAGEFDDELLQWQSLLKRGNPFAGGQARDVMTPFTLALSPDESVYQAAQMFQRTDLPLLPVVNEGVLLGLVTIGECQRQCVHQPEGLVAEIMTADFVRVPGDADYQRAIMQHFLSDDRPAVIYEDSGLRGYLTVQSFVSIVASVRRNTFGDFRGEEGARALLVPDRPRNGARGSETAADPQTTGAASGSAETAVEALATA